MGCLWCLFFGLVCWVRIHEQGIEGLLHYVDDAFNVSFNDELTFYHPYQHLMPADQTRFLLLLDKIGLLHEDKKQFHGMTLEIIRLVVNLNDLTISMSREAKLKLIKSIHDFILNMPDNRCQQPL